MSTALATKPSHIMNTYTQEVRDHAAATQRATDQYFAALERAKTQYFERIKALNDAISKPDEPSAATPPANGQGAATAAQGPQSG